MYKAPITPPSWDMYSNYFAYLQRMSHLAIGSRRQIYSGDRYNHNIVTINQVYLHATVLTIVLM